jgi:hypothetical protein
LKNTCRVVEGRLIEIDVAAGYQSVTDVDDMMAMLGATVANAPAGARFVIAADWRMCKVFTAEVAERTTRMLMGPYMQSVERSAILHRADAATSVMQVFRLVREARFPFRRVFTDAGQMEAWLGELLGDGERQRLRAFLLQRT